MLTLFLILGCLLLLGFVLYPYAAVVSRSSRARRARKRLYQPPVRSGSVSASVEPAQVEQS